MSVKRRFDKSKHKLAKPNEASNQKAANLGFENDGFDKSSLSDLPVASLHDEVAAGTTTFKSNPDSPHDHSEGRRAADNDGLHEEDPSMLYAVPDTYKDNHSSGNDEASAQSDTVEEADDEEIRSEEPVISTNHDPDDADSSMMYAQPDKIEKADREENVFDTEDNVRVMREPAPGSDILYAVPMKKSFRESKLEEGNTISKSSEMKRGDIVLPEVSNAGGASLYEQVDLSGIAMAKMSISDDTPRTEL